LNRTFGAASDSDHFGDLNEMVLHSMPTVEARGTRLLNDLFEIAIIGIAEYLRELAARPELVSGGVYAANALKWRFMRIDQWKIAGHDVLLLTNQRCRPRRTRRRPQLFQLA
jgi:hypothetical protein